MRAAMAVAAVLGGLCWIATTWVDALSVVGAVLLGVAVVGAGASLVNRGATWLRVVVGLCSLALVGSVVLMLRDAVGDEAVLAIAGAAAAIGGAVVLSRRPTGAGRSAGSHAR